MLGHTHVAIAATTTAGAMLISGASFTESLPVIAVAGLCALIPDIDEPNSKVGRKLLIISHIIKKLAGHRGATHSIYVAIIFSAITFTVGLAVWGTPALPYCLAAAWGYASHIYAGDAFTVSGVPWPGKAQNVGIPRNRFNRKFKTGSAKETVLFTLLVVTGAAEGAALFGRFPKLPHINIPSIPIAVPHWLYPPAWTVLVLLALAISITLWTWSRWHWRLSFSRNTMTYKVYFSFHSEDLPLRTEQLGNLLHNLALPKRHRFFKGQPHLRITYACDGEKALYVSCPDTMGFPEKLRDALLDKLRGARIEKVDFEIPKTTTDRRFGRLKLWRKCPAYSMRTLKGFEQDDPLESVLNSLDVGGGKAYIFLLLKPIGPRWKRNARKVREKIRTLDDGDMDKALKRSGIGGILGAFVRSIAAIISGAFSVFQWTPATADAYLLGSAMKPDAGIKDRRGELSEEVKDIVKSMDDKINCRASFRFEIRIMVEESGANWHDVDRIAATFRQYDKHNGLKHNRNRWPITYAMDPMVRMNLWPIFGSKGILSSDELAGFLHNPWRTTTLVKMDLNTSRTEPAAPGLTLFEPGRVYFGT
ncbi:MAG: metal-dependent hydrolase, partial [Actinobacteria bacterium]|nr:metal-dependent hydrolase [Actinomycetota bacterium]